MTLEEFLRQVKSASEPDPAWSPALRALWHAEKGDWKRAHEVCQKGDAREGAWVHANLHREEGDLDNARYWYARAEKPESALDIVDERREILRSLLKEPL